MTKHVEVAWAVAKSEDFDLKDFAMGVLEIAKENLQRDKELVATAFVVTGDQIQCLSVNFSDHNEKQVAYGELVRMAREAKAMALVTCNDAFKSNKAGPDEVEAYYPGKLAAEGASECIMLSVSGPAIQTWCADLPYERAGEAIKFGELSESSR